MSFQQKATSAILAIHLLVYAWYFTYILSQVSELGVEQVEYKSLLMLVIVVSVVLVAVGVVIVGISKPSEIGEVDERDHKVSLLSARVAGIFLTVCVFSVLGLLMSGAHIFWIAQALVVSLVFSEIVMRVTMLIYYQRGV
ncbi:MAG: hypothetical protein L3J22_07285 [Xanthomonadales bacterium]|nr:hypothetical protein [Xanthomonadales bacterium]